MTVDFSDAEYGVFHEKDNKGEEGEMGFNYVDITTKGCEGWLNFFVDDQIIAMVRGGYLASRIRALATKRDPQPEDYPIEKAEGD